ncbi:MAG: acyltransferase domain-containing protein, partial [Blastocatellia bacterium]
MAQLWISWGISPAIVMGHSVGEYVAACIAGVFSLEDGLRLIADRARLMQSLPRDGGMAAIHAPVERVRSYLQGHLDELAIAAINSPKQTVISGRLSVLDLVISQIESNGIGFSRLAVSHAFHSPLMQPVLSQFEKTASSVHYRKPAIDLVSNVTGNLASGEVARSDYWLNHIMSPVDFAGSIQTIDRNRCDVLIEVGPKPALLANGKECIAPEGKLWLPSLRAKRAAWTTLLESLAELYTKGGDIDWKGFDRDYSRRRVSIPNYPFQKQRYWIESSNRSESQEHPLLGRLIEKRANGRDVAVWQVELDDRKRPYLKGHRVFGSSVVPYSVYVELALAAVEEEFGPDAAEIAGLQLHQPVRIEPGRSATLQIVLSQENGNDLEFHAYNQTIHPGSGNPQWTVSASAKIQRVKAQANGVENEVRS